MKRRTRSPNSGSSSGTQMPRVTTRRPETAAGRHPFDLPPRSVGVGRVEIQAVEVVDRLLAHDAPVPDLEKEILLMDRREPHVHVVKLFPLGQSQHAREPRRRPGQSPARQEEGPR